MTSRQDVINRLAADTEPLPVGEPFTVDFYRPDDGYGVARLMYSVYGDGHPIDTYYIPDLLSEENRTGRIRSVVARTDRGKIVCHMALYRSSAINPDLYEIGMGLTLPDYRSSLAFFRCTKLLMTLLDNGTVKGMFGEAVCNHVVTQKLAGYTRSVETAIEIDLMPASTYLMEKASDGRVSCLMAFRIVRDRLRPLCIPDCYREEIGFMMEGIGLEREVLQPSGKALQDESVMNIEFFRTAGVCRCSIIRAGHDIAARLTAMEQELRSGGYALLQCFVPLGSPDADTVVGILRQAGFFMGGFLPAWFGDDGLLLQKLFGDPGFDRIRLFTERSRKILEMIRADWKRSMEG